MIQQLKDWFTTQRRLVRENAFLRVKAQEIGCTYGYDVTHGCPLGYPGCACMDDLLAIQTWCPEDEEKVAVRLSKRLASMSAILTSVQKVLQLHHEWHLADTEENEHGFVPADAYAESYLCDQTTKVMKLTSRDAADFVEAITNPPEPNEALVKLAKKGELK